MRKCSWLYAASLNTRAAEFAQAKPYVGTYTDTNNEVVSAAAKKQQALAAELNIARAIAILHQVCR